MIPYMVGKLAPNSSHLTRGRSNMSPVGAIFVPFPPKTGTKLLQPPPTPQSLNGSSASHDLRLGMDGMLLALCDHGFERSG